jgi:hypothetical protein
MLPKTITVIQHGNPIEVDTQSHIAELEHYLRAIANDDDDIEAEIAQIPSELLAILEGKEFGMVGRLIKGDLKL